MKKVLVVASHPDDEVLGCGGTIARHAKEGDEVSVAFMSDGETSREEHTKNNLKKRNKAAYASCELLGAQAPIFLNFQDNKMDTYALLEIVQKLEKIIDEIQPSVIYTHHYGDLNIDHRITHEAVLTACRPVPMNFVNEIYCFEILSSTDWASPSEKNSFIPNKFIEITGFLEQKIDALKIYEKEMRDFPHSRSLESVESLAKLRGSSAGMHAAESFQVVRMLVKDSSS